MNLRELIAKQKISISLGKTLNLKNRTGPFFVTTHMTQNKIVIRKFRAFKSLVNKNRRNFNIIDLLNHSPFIRIGLLSENMSSSIFLIFLTSFTLTAVSNCEI